LDPFQPSVDLRTQSSLDCPITCSTFRKMNSQEHFGCGHSRKPSICFDLKKIEQTLSNAFQPMTEDRNR
jgi:hypothetical protein